MNNEMRGQARIGVLVPFTNTNLESDMIAMRCPNTTLHFQRMGGYDLDEIPDADQMAGLGNSDISHDIKMIAGVRPHVVLYGCTSATLTHGSSFDTELATRIKATSGAACFTAAGALLAAMHAMNIKKIGFSSPYVGEINKYAMAFFADNGIATVQCADVGKELGNYGQGEMTPDEVYGLACEADDPHAEAIVLSCTDMRSVETVLKIEAALGKPVITSNQAMQFVMMRELGLPLHNTTPGHLFSLLNP